MNHTDRRLRIESDLPTDSSSRMCAGVNCPVVGWVGLCTHSCNLSCACPASWTQQWCDVVIKFGNWTDCLSQCRDPICFPHDDDQSIDIGIVQCVLEVTSRMSATDWLPTFSTDECIVSLYFSMTVLLGVVTSCNTAATTDLDCRFLELNRTTQTSEQTPMPTRLRSKRYSKHCDVTATMLAESATRTSREWSSNLEFDDRTDFANTKQQS